MADVLPNYCEQCGSELATRDIEDRMRAYCPSCSSPQYRNPKPCAGVLLVDEDQLLLVKRTQPPGEGTWSIPAGYLEYDEPPEHAAVRELTEETDMEIAVDDISLFETQFVTHPNGQHVLVLVYIAPQDLADGSPTPGSDAADAQFWSLEALDDSHEEIEPGYASTFERAVTEATLLSTR